MKPSSPPSDVVAVHIPSRLELLGVLDRVADSLCERLQFDEDSRARVSMSVIEAGTNAIQHGHRRDASKIIDVEFRMHPDALEITVRDKGPGFNPQAVNGDITSPEHILDPRGRGIFIMKSCMDLVEFEFAGGGTLCRLVKHRPPRAENAEAAGG